MIKAHIICDDKKTQKILKRLPKLLKAVTERIAITTNHLINYVIVDDEAIQELNRTYRNIDRVTDVLSFATIDGLDDGDKWPYELGDVIIDSERAELQRIEYQHSYEREILFLALHGTLHVLGYDHQNPDDELIMFKIQKEIIDQFVIE